jgi:aminopeptidase N
MKKVTKSVFLVFLFFLLLNKGFYCQINQIDVKEYRFNIRVSDAHDTVSIQETVNFLWKDKTKVPCLNLTSVKKNGKGMKVKNIEKAGKKIEFIHKTDTIYLTGLDFSEELFELEISYSGVPADGLVIGKNKYGNRTFFGDNWPTRAQNWMACNDHLSDKAKVFYAVTAPSHYQVIANGIHQSTIDLSKTEKVWNYKSDIELPTKVMVIGIADFSVKWNAENTISSWVYPENEKGGFYDFDLAPSILEFFSDYIAPYPFSTLANVQSTTRFGGMENAGCIFYDENAINGTRSSEALLAHEIAHQWFGNSATEKDWPHLWLSEGFATYLTLIYQEKVKGGEVFKQELEQDRKQIIAFSKSYPNPVIDSTQKDLMKLLNANSYQKGSWVLHMLRKKVGDKVFKKIIQTYYSTYKLANASSADFERVAEEVSEMELTSFFNQWLRRPGTPQLSIRGNIKKKTLDMIVLQLQKNGIYEFPMKLKINFNDGSTLIETIEISEKATPFKKSYSKKISSFVVDPSVELLFEETK